MQFLRDIMVKADIVVTAAGIYGLVVTRNISLIYLNFTDKISSIFQVMNLNQSMGTSKHSKIKREMRR